MFVAGTITTAGVVAFEVPYACGHCQHSTRVRVIALGQGVGVAPMLIGRDSAIASAQTSAHHTAIEEAQMTVGVAPCPSCGRRDRSSVMRFLSRRGVPLVGLSGVLLAFGSVGAWFLPIVGVPVLLFTVVCMVLLARNLLRAFHELAATAAFGPFAEEDARFERLEAWPAVPQYKSAVPIFIGICAVGALVLAPWMFFSETADVYFVNGLDVPVTVDFDGSQLTLPPGGSEHGHRLAGDKAVTVSANGRIVGREKVVVVAGETAIYNVAGVGPLWVTRKTPRGTELRTLSVGRTLVQLDRGWSFEIKPGGWRVTVQDLEAQQNWDVAVVVAAAVRGVERRNAEALQALERNCDRAGDCSMVGALKGDIDSF